MAGGADGSIITSIDGVNWTTPQKVVASGLWGIAYGGGKFVAVAWSGWITSSVDGETWITPTQIGTSNWWNVAYSSGKFMAVGVNGRSTTSTDGVTWTEPTKMKDESGNDVNGTLIGIVPMP